MRWSLRLCKCASHLPSSTHSIIHVFFNWNFTVKEELSHLPDLFVYSIIYSISMNLQTISSMGYSPLLSSSSFLLKFSKIWPLRYSSSWFCVLLTCPWYFLSTSSIFGTCAASRNSSCGIWPFSKQTCHWKVHEAGFQQLNVRVWPMLLGIQIFLSNFLLCFPQLHS